LTEKDNENLKKGIELRRISNEAALEKGSNAREIIALRDQCKAF
jgi:hypothetical protein